jgi:hypothetical protein
VKKSSHPVPPVEADSVLDEAVARALRDNLDPLRRTVEDLQHAYGDLVAACSSSRPANALPAMVRAQSASAALSAALAVLSNFVTIAIQPRERKAGVSEAERATESVASVAVAEPEAPAPPPRVEIPVPVQAALAVEPAPEEVESEWAAEEVESIVAPAPAPVEAAPAGNHNAPAVEETKAPAFDVATLSAELQELHRRANRVAKVAMQDIKLLRPKDVRLGRENKDICTRLRGDLDKARKEYDRRFRTILDHPVDYFHDWMVAILAEGDAEALGEYPYPSPVLHH